MLKVKSKYKEFDGLTEEELLKMGYKKAKEGFDENERDNLGLSDNYSNIYQLIENGGVISVCAKHKKDNFLTLLW